MLKRMNFVPSKDKLKDSMIQWVSRFLFEGEEILACEVVGVAYPNIIPYIIYGMVAIVVGYLVYSFLAVG